MLRCDGPDWTAPALHCRVSWRGTPAVRCAGAGGDAAAADAAAATSRGAAARWRCARNGDAAAAFAHASRARRAIVVGSTASGRCCWRRDASHKFPPAPRATSPERAAAITAAAGVVRGSFVVGWSCFAVSGTDAARCCDRNPPAGRGGSHCRSPRAAVAGTAARAAATPQTAPAATATILRTTAALPTSAAAAAAARSAATAAAAPPAPSPATAAAATASSVAPWYFGQRFPSARYFWFGPANIRPTAAAAAATSCSRAGWSILILHTLVRLSGFFQFCSRLDRFWLVDFFFFGF